MKVAKSYKIIVLIVAFLLSMACALGFMNVSTASAESTVATKDYFNLNGATASFDDKGLNVSVVEGKEISFKNDLMVNDLSLKMKLPKGVTTSFVLKLDSFYVNGNPKEWSKYNTNDGTTFETSIKNIVELSYDDNDNTKIDCKINKVEIADLSLVDGYLTLNFGIKNNYLTVDDEVISYSVSDHAIYYKVANIDDRAVVKGLAFDFTEFEAEYDKFFILESVDQKRSDNTGAYKQSLKKADVQSKQAKPRAYLNEDFYIRNADGSYSATKKAYNDKYKLDIKTCSVLGGYRDLFLVNPENKYDGILLESDATEPNELRFTSISENNEDKITFGVGEIKKVDGKEKPIVYEEFGAKVVDCLDINIVDNAPKYTKDDIAKASFENAVNQAITSEDGKSVAIGTEFKLPSLKDLVSDDYVAYENLTSKIYYRNIEESQDTSSTSFKIDHIGKYNFFVTFSDGKNEIEEKDFFIVKDNGDVEFGKYSKDPVDENDQDHVGNFIFEFEIVDNADIEVSAPEENGKGYKGVEYKASKFIVDAEGCVIKYQLFYNSNSNAKEDDKNWVEIPKASTLTDEKYNVGGFNYDAVKEVAYDGELTFVPTKLGAYKIVCTATSSVSEREDFAETIIKVESEPKVVEVPSKWLENNLLSVIFLSVGTLCLIGIVVLLFIKPKEKKEEN